MPSNSPSRNSTVAVFSASVLAAATVSGFVAYFNGDTYQVGTQEVTTASGSTVTAGGGRFQATNLAEAKCLKDDNGRYYDCYQEAPFTATGGCVAGGCGTKSYNVASITKPFTGSGVIRNTQVTCDNVGLSTAISVGQVAATTSSGVGIFRKVTISSGSLLGTNSGNVIWNETTPIIKVSASANVNSDKCLLAVWSDEMYNP